MCRNKTVLGTLVAILFLLLLVERSSSQESTDSDLYYTQHELSLIIFNAINNAKKTRNVFFSPYAMSRSLLSSYFLAGGQTERYLKKVLRLEDLVMQNKSDLFIHFIMDTLLVAKLDSEAKFDLGIATKLYISRELPIKSNLPNKFPKDMERISFRSSPEAARNSINQWIENTTHHMILDTFRVGTIDQNTDMVVANAASLGGSLEKGFDPRLTRKEVFYIGISKRVVVPMMYLEGRFKHGISETFGAHVLEMPYKEDMINLYVLLQPFTDDSKMDFILKSLTVENLRKLVSGDGLTTKNVQVAFPKLSMESTVDITAILESLVVGNFFESDVDLSWLVSGNERVSVGQGIHKAKIEIAEQSENTTSELTEGKIAKFICNHPFVFVIYCKTTSAVLFMGIVRNPISLD